jgi:hypothetical protein
MSERRIRLDGTVTIEGESEPDMKLMYRLDWLDGETIQDALLRCAEKLCREIHALKTKSRIV